MKFHCMIWKKLISSIKIKNKYENLSIFEGMQLRGGISEEEICNVLLELAIENQEDWSDSTW